MVNLTIFILTGILNPGHHIQESTHFDKLFYGKICFHEVKSYLNFDSHDFVPSRQTSQDVKTCLEDEEKLAQPNFCFSFKNKYSMGNPF